MFEALLNLMSRALEDLNSLPWGIHALVALGMAAGIVLWLAGQRMLKPMLIAAAALLGAVLGGLIVPSTSWGAAMSVWHGLGIGLIAGLLAGLLLYRSAMAVGFGIVLAAALPLIAASILQFYPIGDSDSDSVVRQAEGAWERLTAAGDSARAAATSNRHAMQTGYRVLRTSWMDDGAATDQHEPVEIGGDFSAPPAPAALANGQQLPDNLRPLADRISNAWSQATGEVRTQWESLPRPHQAIVGLAGVIGLAGGVIAGLFMPAWASSTVTALFGAAVWLPCLVWLSNAFSAPWRAQFDRSPAAWLVIWAAVALVGMIVQWSGVLRKKGKAKPAAPAPA